MIQRIEQGFKLLRIDAWLSFYVCTSLLLQALRSLESPSK